MKRYNVIVIGAGVIGTPLHFGLLGLSLKSGLVLGRGTIGAGTTSQSSDILRTHYFVKENVELARRSSDFFNNFSPYLEGNAAPCGLIKSGNMIVAADNDKLHSLRTSTMLSLSAMSRKRALLTRISLRQVLHVPHAERASPFART